MTEEVKTQEVNQETAEVNQEAKTESNDVDGVQESENNASENLKAAVAKYRDALKKYKGIDPEQYKKLVEEKAQAEEKEKLRKWKYEEVIGELKTKLDEYEQYKSFYDSNLQKEQGKFEALMQQVPEEKRSFVEKITSKADNVFEKVELVNELIPTFKKQDFDSAPSGESKTQDVRNKFEEAKAKGDITWLIANAKPLS